MTTHATHTAHPDKAAASAPELDALLLVVERTKDTMAKATAALKGMHVRMHKAGGEPSAAALLKKAEGDLAAADEILENAIKEAEKQADAATDLQLHAATAKAKAAATEE